uniref:Uncharacterized protein n=1 Tax=Sphaerodactylus townsendi TaxID=933632 RepID=A0ACB8FJ64_9SAUR
MWSSKDSVLISVLLNFYVGSLSEIVENVGVGRHFFKSSHQKQQFPARGWCLGGVIKGQKNNKLKINPGKTGFKGQLVLSLWDGADLHSLSNLEVFFRFPFDNQQLHV